MTKLMELWSTYLGPATDTRLDLGAINYRWNNLYLAGSINSYSAIATTGFTARLVNTQSINNLDLIDFNYITGQASPPFGALWLDSARSDFMTYSDMKKVVGGTIFVSTANGVVSNTTAEGTLVGSGIGTIILPDSFFLTGKTVRLTASGYYSTQSIPVTLNVRVRIGGAVGGSGGVEILTTGDNTPAGNVSNLFWRVICDLICNFYDGDTTGSIIAQSAWEHQSTATGSPVFWQMTTITTINIKTDTENRVQLTANWGAGVAAADSMACTNFILESIG